MVPGNRRLVLLAFACVALNGCGSRSWVWSGEETATSRPVVFDPVVYFAGTRFGVMHYLNAILLGSGASAWRVRLRGWMPYTRVAAGGDIVVAGSGEFLRAFSTASGRDVWRVSLGVERLEAMALAAGTVSLVVAGPEGAREALLIRAADGRIIAALPLAGGTRVWRWRHRLYVGDGARLGMFDVSTGAAIWSSGLPVAPSRLVPSGDTVVVVGGDRIVGVSEDDGVVRWVRETDGEVAFRSSDGLGCYAQGGRIRAIDVRTGDGRWSRRISGVVSPPILAGNRLWVHTAGGWLLALDRTNGRIRWQMQVGPPGSVAAATERFYAWMDRDGVHLVDQARRVVRIIAGATPEPVPANGHVSPAALGIEGVWLWGVFPGGARVVVHRLE